VDRKSRLFRRVETATRVLPEFPLAPRTGRRSGPGERAQHAARPALAASIGRRAAQAAERYSPAYGVVDRHYEVLHFSDRAGRYIEPAPGRRRSTSSPSSTATCGSTCGRPSTARPKSFATSKAR
jgi:two-component system, chemotaxis family, CheB/CheR fusion protein